MTQKQKHPMTPNKDLQFSYLDQIHACGINIDTREIWLHSMYGETGTDEIDYKMSTTFLKNIFFLNSLSKSKITIHLHSNGGEWAAGMAIYDAIRISPSPTTILGHAAVCSMATIIMQAATKRYLMPNADFMIHYGSIDISSDTLAATTDIKQNQRYTEQMIDIFAHRANESKATGVMYYKKLIKTNINKKGNWWLTPSEALDIGFVDGIIHTPNDYQNLVLK